MLGRSRLILRLRGRQWNDVLAKGSPGWAGTGLGETDEDARVVPGLRARMRATGSNNTNYNKDRHLARISFS